jgi:hypothetical protein
MIPRTFVLKCQECTDDPFRYLRPGIYLSSAISPRFILLEIALRNLPVNPVRRAKCNVSLQEQRFLEDMIGSGARQLDVLKFRRHVQRG